MTMIQLVIGAALGFLVAQGALHGSKWLIGWIQRHGVREWIRTSIPAPGSSFISGLIRHAGLIGASAAVIALSVWAVSDYLRAGSARSTAVASASDASMAPASDTYATVDEVAGLAPASRSELATAVPADTLDPYADSDFKVHRRPHRAGAAPTLKETLLQRSEAKARADLLRETQLHVHRSQYDCEAAERANKYLKADLDVWGFAAWQVKYFPVAGYKGATLPQCKDVKNVVDPSWLDLQSTVAQGTHSTR